ncbi:MAG: hypothetical protein RLZZ324_1263 [Candidatus Parcubacteria bacterium]|jgi:ASC-1-like (ASCH) protein/ribosomal protein S18 acetylase RimI-like enzyme
METTHVHIRQAEQGDEHWVTDMMERVLQPFYDGNHRTHAQRIFAAHLAGGQDTLGFFSHEQRMFVAEVGGVPAGIIHVVGKRQQTYKISPLMVLEQFRGTRGIGKALLAHAETYAVSHRARQLYCTVAAGNRLAMQFFLRHGFVVAGSSENHYKHGSKEIMLYKELHDPSRITTLDAQSISVIPFQEEDADQVRAFIKRHLPDAFAGIDDSWVDALFAGYRRRHGGDVDTKYKLIYVAKDSTGTVLGLAAATPKKGTPIKLMPFIATSQQVFNALLSDLPFMLAPLGHKLYIHASPGVDEVLSLQRHGWRLDAALPGAYRPDVVTQQWSLDIGVETMRTMRLKKHFFDHIAAERKTLEVRVGYDNINNIAVGERIRLVSHGESLVVRVSDKRTYRTFSDMLAKEPFGKIAPDAATAEEVLKILKGFYDDKKEALGVVVLEFRRDQG